MYKIITKLLTFFYNLIVGCFIALLPIGFLPRKDVKSKIVLITGGGNGLGRNLAISFGKLGSKIVLWDVDKKGLEETMNILKEDNVECWNYVVDVTNKDQIYEVANKVKKTIGTVDILINNAGIANGKLFINTSDNDLQKIININLMAHFYTCKAFLPDMITKNSGHIVNMASLAGKVPSTGIVDYSCSKFAVVGFSSALEEELNIISNGKIKVTTICPYFIKTNLTAELDVPSTFLLPVIEPEEATEIMMEGILTEQSQILLPKFSYIFALLYNILPTRAFYALKDTQDLKNRIMEQVEKREKKED
ncbi:Epidermal retinol dehydrogenase 2 [Strongyloides ratti]|uniref:Short-chain dehydrogenase/reductase 3 n=1 Tax=Strongyloides ratti TaxID=34506 RepID=A0A090LPH3_STRRB|nr:Epidermal retinol dehydrogenase 2 [Strongyloides ratti]CEF69440.1 Epidermal retinol dehydrogenase 2 [Strongyloides ratti]